MTSLCKVLGGRFLLSVVLWACACQHDSVATFDATGLPGSPHGGALGAAGSVAKAGDAAVGGDETSGAGASSEAGSKAAGGKAGATNGGVSGRGGSSTAGTSSAGKPSMAGEGGSAGSAVAGGGSGGTKEPDPQPVTVMITDFADTNVVSCLNSNQGDAQTLKVDSASICVYDALLNPSLADVPDGALVSAATLTLHCIDTGDVVEVSYVSGAWNEDTVRWSTRPDAGSEIAELSCDEMHHASLDLTAAVKAWVSGERAANGLYLRTEGSDGTDIASSEYGNVDERPILSVTYTLPTK
jgi:hypothetical protein